MQISETSHHHISGRDEASKTRAENLIKQIHGPTTKTVGRFNRTIYKNADGKAIALGDPDDDGEQTWHIHKQASMKESMNLFQKVQALIEEAGVKYDSGVGHTARVFSKNGIHTAKLFGTDGKHNKDTDYSSKDADDVHDFAREEMAIKKAAAKKKVNESIDPKDHIEQTLADMDINSKVDGKKVSVHKSNKAKAARVVKKMGYDHEVGSGLNEDDISERINMPQGHKETADPISDGSSKHGVAAKKMMGNRSAITAIANIITKKVKPE